MIAATGQGRPAVKRKFHAAVSLKDFRRSLIKNYDLYLITIPVVAYFLIFAYWPMYGVQIAFRDFSPSLGIEKSPWVGLKHLEIFADSFYFWRLIRNTVGISLYGILIGIPAPIVLAIIFEEVRNRKLRSVLQSVSYAPNFMSTVVVCGIILMFLSPQSGVIPAIFKALGITQKTSLIADKSLFWHIYVWSGVWQSIGWGSLIYTAAISGIPTEQYEAARIEGANKLQQIFNVTIPNIMSTIVIISILSVGGIMSIRFEKVFLLQNANNQEFSEVISTYVYKVGLLDRPRYSFASMVGLFNSIINMVILVIVNFFAKRYGETSLW